MVAESRSLIFGCLKRSSSLTTITRVQAKEDASISFIKEGTVAHVIYRKGLNYLYKKTWRPIKTMDNFHKLGIKHENVIALTLAQMHSLPMGAPLSDAEIDTIVNSGA